MRPARASARASVHQEHLERRLDDLARWRAPVRHDGAVGDDGGEEDDDGDDDWDQDAEEDGDGGDGAGAPRARRALTAPALPVPGRHAGRRAAPAPAPRAREAVAALLPAGLRGSVRLGATHLAVVAVVVACGLAWTCWWVVRADPRTVQAPASSVEQDLEPAPDLVRLSPVAVASDAVPGAAGAEVAGASPDALPVDTATPVDPAAAGAGESVTVDVAGRVRRPGVVVLAAGSRVVDALDAAGGARRGVGLSALNLARVLVDGEQVLVGPPPPGVPAAATVPGVVPGATATPGAAPATVAPVDLNTADQVTLETLPQVGPVTAQAILAWREQHGAFTAVEELLEVDGIGDATLAQIAPHATV